MQQLLRGLQRSGALLVVVEGGEGLLGVLVGDALGPQPAFEGVHAHGLCRLGLGHALGVSGVVQQPFLRQPRDHRLHGRIHIAPAAQRLGQLARGAVAALEACQRGLIGVVQLQGSHPRRVLIDVNLVPRLQRAFVEVLPAYACQRHPVRDDIHQRLAVPYLRYDGHFSVSSPLI